MRLATFNVALSRRGSGVLLKELTEGSAEIDAVVEIILRVRPDILFLNELDRDAENRALARFVALLAAGRDGMEGIEYPYAFAGPVNTGIRSGVDFDGDGKTGGPRDAYGYGRFPGQYGMAVLSRFPLETGRVRTFQLLPWAAMPGALRPVLPDGSPYRPDEVWAARRLSSKSHWDLPVRLPDGRALHLLASHPTPPVFDGPEDLNGRRNHDEIRFWADYLDGAAWIADDAGTAGGLPGGVAFAILGDLNADPVDGEGRQEAIRALIAHPLVQDPAPASEGAAAATAAGEASAAHDGDGALDTADWSETGAGNLRVDYVLVSRNLRIAGAGVFWPAPGEPGADLLAASDHRLVWVDIALERAE